VGTINFPFEKVGFKTMGKYNGNQLESELTEF